MPHRPRLDQSCSGPAPVGSGTTLLLARTELGTKSRCDPSNGPSAVEGEAAVPCTHRPFVLITRSCHSSCPADLVRTFGAAAYDGSRPGDPLHPVYFAKNETAEVRDDRARNGSRPGHPLHPLFVAKDESSDWWVATAKNSTLSVD